MDERELRQLFHETYDPVTTTSDPFRLLRESADPAPLRRILVLAGGTCLAALVVAGAVLFGRAVVSQTVNLAAAEPTAGTAVTVATPTGISLRAHVASEYPTPRVAAVNSEVVLVSVGDSILRSTDAGRTWQTTYAGRSDHAGNVRDLEWVTHGIAFAATNYGLLRSDDAGDGWRLVNARSDLRRIDFVSGGVGYAVAGTDARGSDWHLLRTADGGAGFVPYVVGLSPVTWIQWVSQTSAWAAGPGGIVVTSDAGEHWQAQLLLREGQFRDAQVGLVDEDSGFAYFRAAGSSTPAAVYRTSDGGLHWRSLGAPDTVPGFQDDQLVVTGSSTAEIVTQPAASDGMARCTSPDAGARWRCVPVALGAQAGAREVARGPVRMLTALKGDRVLIATSADRGATWSTVEVDASAWTRR